MKNTIRLFAVLALLSISITGVAQEKKSKEKEPRIEKMPQFPGGEKAMVDFIADNLRYPNYLAKDKRKEGRVIVRFRVDETGKIKNVRVSKGIGIEYDNEAMRVVKLMPDWSPATRDGKAVPMRFTIPIIFRGTRH